MIFYSPGVSDNWQVCRYSLSLLWYSGIQLNSRVDKCDLHVKFCYGYFNAKCTYKKIIPYTFCPSPPCAMLTKHFHLTQVCILPFSNIERGNGGVDPYSVSITIIISCFWLFPTQFIQGCKCLGFWALLDSQCYAFMCIS